MHVQQDSLTTPEQSFETVRALLGFDVSFRPSEIIALLDSEYDKALQQTDQDHWGELAFCVERREIDAAHNRHAAAVTAIRKKHTEDIQRVQQWDANRAAQTLHARHETRDEAGEATEALRAMAEGGAA